MTTTATRLLLLLLCFAAMALSLAAASPALAGPFPTLPTWTIVSQSNSTVAPGGQLAYPVQVRNIGEKDTSGTTTFTVTLPEGMTAVGATTSEGIDCPDVPGATGSFTCTASWDFGPEDPITPTGGTTVRITVEVAADATGVLTPAFEVAGGGAPQAASTVDPVLVTPEPLSFGFDAFDLQMLEGTSAFTQAARRPDELVSSINFPVGAGPNVLTFEQWPVEDSKDIVVDLPPGLVGNPSDLAQCTQGQLSNGGLDPKPECPPASQVGVASVGIAGYSVKGPIPVYNMVPPPNEPASFAFNVAGSIVILGAGVRSEGDYGLRTTVEDIPQALTLTGSTVTFWGVPAGPAHDGEHSCPGVGEPAPGPPPLGHPPCPPGTPPSAFLRAPTSCTGPIPISARMDSWQHPRAFVSDSIVSHQTPGYPYARQDWGAPVGIEGCDQVPFEPAVDASLTTARADSPTGLSVDIGLPADCWEGKATEIEAEEALCQSDMRKAEVTLPPGLSLNPAAASGRQSCTPDEVGLATPVGASPIHFDKAPVSCPDSSKIGEVEIETPLLGKHDPKTHEPVLDPDGHPVLEPLKGGVYLAEQGNNPFGSLLAIYLVAEGSGVTIKQAGEIALDPSTGQVTTTFSDAPQQPFSKLHVELFGGSRATLRTPASCGTYATTAELTPWSGNPAVTRHSSFQVSEGCGGGFDPKLQAGTENPLAGATTPLNLRITREDASQELAGLDLGLPPGLVGSLAGYTYCPDSTLAAISTEPGSGSGEEGAPSCPASSRVGSVTVGAGAGISPFYTSSGRAYLAGPYKGAPVSLAVVAPAVAGPFDLGSVVVRNAIHIDPTTAQLSVDSDPLPTILHGIPLDLRDVRVRYDQAVNPTSCEPMRIGSTITSSEGKSASPSVHFQVAGCDRLGFKPRLSLSLSGPTHRAAHPRLRAVLRARPGDANIAGATVLLPKTELLENAHIRTICTRVQFAAAGGSGAGCPKGSVYGYAKAWTPLLDQPLQGPVYLRSNGGERELPDLVASLGGQIHVDLVGYIDSVHERIRNRFALVPDAPVSKFELTMQGGGKGLLANNTNLCRAKPHASAQFLAQNNRVRELQPLVKAGCGGKAGHKKRHRR